MIMESADEMVTTRGRPDQNHLVEMAGFTDTSTPYKLLFIGGQDLGLGEPLSLVDMYDVTGGDSKDVRIPPLPGKRLDASLVNKDDTFYLTGGFDGDKSCDTVFRFNQPEMRWVELKKMKFARHGHSTCIVDDCIIVAGGIGNNMKRTASVEAYNIVTNEWISLPDFPHGPVSNSACCEHNGNFIISGGMSVLNLSQTFVYAFNMSSKRWVGLPDLQFGRSQHNMVSHNGDLYVLGDVTNRTIERYDSNTNTFVIIGELPVEKCGTSAVVLEDTIILAGGWNSIDPIVTYNVRTQEVVTHHIKRNCLSSHVALFKQEVLSLWVLSRTFLRSYLNKQPSTEDSSVTSKIETLPLPKCIKDEI